MKSLDVSRIYGGLFVILFLLWQIPLYIPKYTYKPLIFGWLPFWLAIEMGVMILTHIWMVVVARHGIRHMGELEELARPIEQNGRVSK